MKKIVLLIFKKFIVLVVLVMLFSGDSYSAEEATETERIIRRRTPAISVLPAKPEKEDELYFSSFFEHSSIMQGTRTGYWSELINRYGYLHRNIQSSFSVSRFQRFDEVDYTGNFESTFSFKDSYATLGLGFGWNIDFIYNLQTIAGYAFKVYDNLFLETSYEYRDYDAGDTHLLKPGLIYYFGNHYMGVDYGMSFIVDRDIAQFVRVKGNFQITKFLQFFLGGAFGERLFDIYGLPAGKERGYILYTGVNIEIMKDVSARVGYSYSEEDPKFIKRSLDFGLTAKF